MTAGFGDSESGEVARELFRRAAEGVDELERMGQRPFGSRKIPVACAGGCGDKVWVSAAAAWDAEHGGPPLWPFRCRACQDRTLPIEPERLEPWLPSEVEDAALRTARRVAELDRLLLGPVDAAMIARKRLGEWDVQVRIWRTLQDWLCSLVGAPRARAMLVDARAQAGTGALVERVEPGQPEPVGPARQEPETRAEREPPSTVLTAAENVNRPVDKLRR